MFLYIFCWFIVLFLIFTNNRNLLVLLLLLELISFFTIFFFVFASNSLFSLDFYVLILFSVFVIEGVLGLAGIVILVSYSGSDFLNASSFLNW